RAQIDKILREQELSAAGLLDRSSAIKVGRLLRADAFLLLSAEAGRSKEKNKAGLLRVRLVETAHGLRLWDGFEPFEASKFAEIVRRITGKISDATDKLTLAPGQAIPVGIVDVHRVQLNESHHWLTRAMPSMLSVRLSKEPRIVMLEREDLNILRQETLLTEGEDAEFWNSGVLIDGYLQPGEDKDLQLKLQLKGALGVEVAGLTVSLQPDEPALAVDRVAADIIRELLNAPPATNWEPKREAEEFFHQGQLLYSHGRYEDAITVLETAHALQPKNVFYTGGLFNNGWALHQDANRRNSYGEVKYPHYSDLELAELVSRLVRQIRDGYEQGLLSERDIKYRWGRSLGTSLRSRGYLASPASVSTDPIRKANREIRKMWVAVFDAALQDQPSDEDYNLTSVCLAWISSDDPDELVANLKRTFTEFVMPPELGGKIRSTEERHRICEQAFDMQILFPSSSYFDITHLRGSSDRFLALWIPYLKELAESTDPVARLYGRSARARNARRAGTRAQEVRRSRNTHKAIESLEEELKNANKSIREAACQQLRRLLRPPGARTIGPDESVRLWQEIAEPLIEKKDAETLAMLDPGWRPFHARASDLPPGAARRYYDLLARIAQVLETRNDRQTTVALSKVMDFRAEIRKKFPQFDSVRTAASLACTMLLRKQDLGWQDAYWVLAEHKDNFLWVASSPRSHRGNRNDQGITVQLHTLAVAGIDTTNKQLIALWETQSEFPEFPGRLTGMVVGQDATYLSLDRGGLMTLPASHARGQRTIENPKMLTQEHGLPSRFVTSIARQGNKLWIAYGGKEQESGLGLYDPEGGDWETVFCSALEDEPPFSAARPYEIRSLTFVSDSQLFFLAHGIENGGLWKMNTGNRKMKYFGPAFGTPYPSFAGNEHSDNQLCLQTSSYLVEYDTGSQRMRLVVGDLRRLLANYSRMNVPLSLEKDLFVPETCLERIHFGRRHGGYFDLGTAAIYNDQLWALLGKSRIIAIRRGESMEDARIVDNTILDGEPAHRFISTPHGLFAIGEGTIGLVETEK
ncbi:MAG: tetratricopeptide repeat protein, partial [Planctomycetota bacterium]